MDNNNLRFKIIEVRFYKMAVDMSTKVVFIYFDHKNTIKKSNSLEVDIADNVQAQFKSTQDGIAYAAKLAALSLDDLQFYHAVAEYAGKHGASLPYNTDMEVIKPKHAHADVVFEPPDVGSNTDLMGIINRLPGVLETVPHPLTGDKAKIKDIIISLNDSHHWPRERVADWLETLDIDLRFRSDDDTLREQRQKRLNELRAKLERSSFALNDLAEQMKNVQFEIDLFKKTIKELEEE